MKNLTQRIGMQGLAVAGLCLSLIGCAESFDTSFFEKDIKDPEFNIELAGLPIGYTTYTAKELFEEIGDDIEVGTTDDNGKSVVSFSYSQSLSAGENSDFVSVDDQTFEGDFQLLADAPIPGGSYEYGTFQLADDEIGASKDTILQKIQTLANIDSDLTAAEFSEGTLTINITTTTEAQTELNFKIPSLIRKDNGNPYNKDFLLKDHSIPANNVNTITVNLSNYEFDFTIDQLNPSQTNNGFNKIAVEIEAVIIFNDGDNISTSDELNYTISLANPKVKTAEGDFKDASFNVENQTFDLDFFKELGDGTINFENPTLKLSATSGYGFPVGLTLESIAATDGTTTTNLAITDASPTEDNIEPVAGGTGNYAIIDAAASNGETKTSNIILNNQNSNLADLLNAKPTQFNLNVTAGANPNRTNNANFFDVDNTLAVDVNVELPLYVTFKDLSFSPDPFEFDSEEISDNASSLSLRVGSRNSIPLKGIVTLEFVKNTGTEQAPVYEVVTYANADNVVTDFKESVNVINAAPIDAQGFSKYTLDNEGVLKEGSSIIEPSVAWLNLTKEQIAVMDEVTHIQAYITFDTVDSDNSGEPNPAKIQSTDQVRLDLAIKGDLKITTKDEDDNN